MKATLIGTLLAGTLDLADALIFFGNRGALPIRILQSISSGVQGVEAYRGGWTSATVGFVLHFVIALLAAVGYYLVLQSVPRLQKAWFRKNWALGGMLYGLAFYLLMNLIVIPVSAFPNPVWPPVVSSVLINGVLAHLFLVGLPIAWAQKKFS